MNSTEKQICFLVAVQAHLICVYLYTNDTCIIKTNNICVSNITYRCISEFRACVCVCVRVRVCLCIYTYVNVYVYVSGCVSVCV